MGIRKYNQPHTAIGKLLFISMFAVVLSLLLAGCKKNSNEQFIQGVWYHKNAHLANIPAESAQVTDWEFTNYYFSVSACCFAEIYFSGYYSIADSKENEITLDLFNMTGYTGGTTLSRDDTMTLVIKIDPEADTININGDGPYTRVNR